MSARMVCTCLAPRLWYSIVVAIISEGDLQMLHGCGTVKTCISRMAIEGDMAATAHVNDTATRTCELNRHGTPM